jgi:3-hydroxyisobutyrate dehydrogenase-like beta-hydroxyacid dehydrogenase
MGHAVGRRLREQELRVVTCLAGRSQRTRALSEQAGIEDLATMAEMVAASDVILSITTSEAAPLLCQEVADAIRNAGTELLFAECNAIAPQKTRSLEPIIKGVGSRYVDASIIGGPPRPGYSPHIYASGEHAPELGQLRDHGLDIRVIGNEVGQASGLKMTYAASTKGATALFTQLLLAAEQMGLSEYLRNEIQDGPIYKRMLGAVPSAPSRAQRWVSEMEEIEATFEHLGTTAHLFQGVAEMYRLLGATPLGDERPETRDAERTLEDTVRLLAGYISNDNTDD